MSKLYEEVNPFQFTGKGKMDVADASVRDNINTLLTGALMSCTLTPYIALEKVRKVLAYYHISIPGTSFMEGDRGIKTFDVEQFGLKFGMKNDGQIVNFNSVDKDMTHGAHIDGENFNYFTAPGTEDTDEKFHIYFEYKMNDKGLFDVFSEIVTDDELEDLLDDAEEDINADKSEDDRDERLNEAKTVSKEVLKELRMLNPDGSTAFIDSGIGRSNEYNITKPVQREPAKVEPGSLIGARGPMNPKGIDVDKPPSNSSSNKSWDSNPAFQKSGGDGPLAGTDPFKDVTPNRAGTTSSLPSGSTPMQDPNKLADVKKSFTMQETSHESVNHVRRLAMKNKRNDR